MKNCLAIIIRSASVFVGKAIFKLLNTTSFLYLIIWYNKNEIKLLIPYKIKKGNKDSKYNKG